MSLSSLVDSNWTKQVNDPTDATNSRTANVPCVMLGTLSRALPGTHVIMKGFSRRDSFSLSVLQLPRGSKCAASILGFSLTLTLSLAC